MNPEKEVPSTQANVVEVEGGLIDGSDDREYSFS